MENFFKFGNNFIVDTLKQLKEYYGKELNLNVVVHLDQGVHYTSKMYQTLSKEMGITISMSRKGNCWNNSPQESFFAILKT